MIKGFYKKPDEAPITIQHKTPAEIERIRLVLREITPDRRRVYLKNKLLELAILKRHGSPETAAMDFVLKELAKCEEGTL